MMEEEEEIKKLEEELKNLDSSLSSGYGSPEPTQKDNIFKFFREILRSNDSTKTGNLKDSELGTVKLGVRHYKEIAAYAEAEGLDLVGAFLKDKAEIISSTSMSRKGFLAQLFVTQIKKEQKMSEPKKVKKGFFVDKKTEEEE